MNPKLFDMSRVIVHHRWKPCGWIGPGGEFHWLGPVSAGPVHFRVIHADGRHFRYFKPFVVFLAVEALCMVTAADRKWGQDHGELQVECLEGES